MSGIVFILREFQMTKKELAERLDITPQSLNDWIIGRRKIPKARLEQMTQIFTLDEKYFMKDENEYTEVERLEVRLSYFQKSKRFIRDPSINPYGFWTNEEEINRITGEIENKKLLLRIEQLIKDVGRAGEKDYNLKSTNNYNLLEKIEYVLSNEEQCLEITKELRSLFEKFKIMKCDFG